MKNPTAATVLLGSSLLLLIAAMFPAIMLGIPELAGICLLLWGVVEWERERKAAKKLASKA
jgi:hypothetical protein